ncbi:MAG: serine hydrolase [Candidatus Saccharimonas sp.]|nr:serine hydrolase [Candidatus Saccharimonas sp.]
MWTRKHVLFGVGALLLVELCVQLLYPYDRALPFATVGTVRAGFSSRSDLARIFQEQFEGSKVELVSGDRKIVMPLSKLGASIGSDQMAARLTEYPLWQRLLPLSIVINRPHVPSLQIAFTGSQVTTAVSSIAGQLSAEPTDAVLSLERGALKVGTAKEGRTVTNADIIKALVAGTYHLGTTTIQVPGKVISPARGDNDIAEAKRQAEAALAREVTLEIVDKKRITIDAATKASWLAIDLAAKPATLTTNSEAIASYVTSLNDGVKTEAIPTAVTIVDGTERSRKEGTSGSALDVGDVVAKVGAALIGTAGPAISVQLQPVAPSTTYARSYTNSQAGLQAYVAYATSTQNVRIVVQQLDGPGWSASGRAEESIPSASTYKLYVMLRVFDDINNGSLTWDTPMLDTTAGGCFERTIVPSTNPCAEEWIRRYGRDNLNSYVHSKGFSSGTGFTFNDATHTTAGDLAKYLIGLNNGTLVSGNNRDMLLEKMGRQLYRYGIPTGTSGWAQDKVGFLWEYIHDAAIVHNPKGTYVLVIMTKGYSYGYIANVARQIDMILYP